MPLPGGLIAALKAAPAIASAAAGVLQAIRGDKSKSPPSHTDDAENAIQDLRTQLRELRTHSEAQAEVVSQMAAQIETLSDSVRFLSRRISLMNLALFGTSMVAVTALVLAILWS